MFYRAVKRSFDIVISTVVLIIISPLLLLLTAIVKADSRGPAIFGGRRVGRNGREFLIYKFRSMVVNAEALGSPVTTQRDPRVTRVGRFMRRWKLDELPNFSNVWLGDMSLVGPRPESPSMVAKYLPEQRQVLSVRPGIAGIAQIRYVNEQAVLPGEKLDEAAYLRHMTDKLNLDLLYIRTASFGGDMLILCCTALALLGIQIDLESFFRARLPSGTTSVTLGG